MTDLHTLANAISDSSPAIKRFALAVADRLDPPAPDPAKGWQWDARTATVSSSQTSASYVVSASSNAYLSCDVARAFTATTDVPGYSIVKDSGRGAFDSQVYIPLGTKPGCSTDHHLFVLDGVHGRETDFYQASFDGTYWHANGGTSQPLGAVQEPTSGSANAARFASSGGLVTPEDVKDGVIGHALVFSVPYLKIGGPCVYPANQAQDGAGGQGHGYPVWGQWFRLAPDADLSACSGVSLLIAAALKRYGMFLRDGGSNLDIYGVDAVNQGGNSQAYGGVLNLTTNGYPYAAKLSGIPWKALQALEPPTPV